MDALILFGLMVLLTVLGSWLAKLRVGDLWRLRLGARREKP
jgi:hypothetical protein